MSRAGSAIRNDLRSPEQMPGEAVAPSMHQPMGSAPLAVRTSPGWRPHPLEWAWLLSCLATLMISPRTATQALSGTIDTANYLRFSCVLASLTIVALHLGRLPRLRLNPISVFLGYVTIGLYSTFWSAGPVDTLGKSMELLSSVLVVWLSMARPDAEHRLRRLVALTIVESALGLLYVTYGNIFYPAVFHQYDLTRGLLAYSWSSPAIYSNSVSQLGALVGLFCLARGLGSRRRPGSWLFLLGYPVAAIFPVLSQGRTGMVSLVVGSALILARRFPISSVVFLPTLALLADRLLGGTLLKLFLRGQDDQALYSLSGRTTLWELGWQGFVSRPWFGSGWGVGSRTVLQHHLGEFGSLLSSLHNGPLEVLLGVGLIGFVVWAWAVIWSWWLTVVAYLRGAPPEFFIGMVVATTATFLSTGIGGWLDFFLQYFLAATGLLWVQRQQLAEARTLPRGVMPRGYRRFA